MTKSTNDHLVSAVALRACASVQPKAKVQKRLNDLADALEAGKVDEAELQSVADLLAGRESAADAESDSQPTKKGK